VTICQERFEKGPLGSKKFLAFLIGELTWKALIAYMVYCDSSLAGILTAILVAGFVQVGYVLGQNQLDRFIRLATLMADKVPGINNESEKSDSQ
jgi:hypothetical protein